MNKVDEQVAIYERLTNRLLCAGAECVVVTSIAGHFCIEPFKAISPLHVVDMIIETDGAIAKQGYNKIGILGTKTVMETGFYGGIESAEIVPPQGESLQKVHDAYVAMATSGTVNDEQRYTFGEACSNLFDEHGVEAILLGGTDLALVYQTGNTDFPVIDCAAVHCEAIVDLALSD